ncbi:hypothetical protein HMPREF0063_11390 [Aeromicrobium marinum DSM 15272]|uniref:Uncharacterized protein n=1 Tax=Aeromicrobium marinum DSM 15272 TaxID=585531 RepID=E2SBI1_9ACTN|nr:hypothetical protein [Aeromicrobium marinum]EFQ83727.1 hypothetical protein HMPREF0063_11390 [Aeromicrobium marinum DSM 15272]
MYEFAAFALETTTERGLDPNIVKPGWTALIIFGLMVVAVILLCRSFVKQARRTELTWPEEERTTDVFGAPIDKPRD